MSACFDSACLLYTGTSSGNVLVWGCKKSTHQVLKSLKVHMGRVTCVKVMKRAGDFKNELLITAGEDNKLAVLTVTEAGYQFNQFVQL